MLQVLDPIWTTRPETARRVRQRMRTVFRWAMAHGFMDTNPAGEAIDGALPRMPKVKTHLRALPYQEVQAALETVESSQASVSAKLCFRFLVLTAARSGEARGAAWDEIDLQGQEWRIPSQRMKAGMEHRVPLSRQALDTLREASALRDGHGSGVPVAAEAGFADVRHDADEGAPIGGPGGASDRPRVPQQLQELDAGANGYAMGGLGGGACPPPGQCDRTGLRQVRPLRATPRPDAAVGGLRDRLTSRKARTTASHRGSWPR